jgi:hypothetical protein
LKFFTNNTAFDISRARRLLHYEPGYDLESGLRETYSYLSSEAPLRLPLPAPADRVIQRPFHQVALADGYNPCDPLARMKATGSAPE